jgi:hypothetical protein
MREISNKIPVDGRKHLMESSTETSLPYGYLLEFYATGLGDPAKPLGAAGVPERPSSLVCVFCNGELRVETLSKYDVFLIMCDACGQEMIDCNCVNLRSGRGSTRTGRRMHHSN